MKLKFNRKKMIFMNKKEYLKSQKDCAKMLGLSLKKYNESLKNIKVVKFDNKKASKKDTLNILYELGLNENDLKKHIC